MFQRLCWPATGPHCLDGLLGVTGVPSASRPALQPPLPITAEDDADAAEESLRPTTPADDTMRWTACER